uniref:Uncharacterized protein n=1 Tax=Rhizophora mucronata TaxID=61149 RepID=A0A2P2IW94_RHIMU
MQTSVLNEDCIVAE